MIGLLLLYFYLYRYQENHAQTAEYRKFQKRISAILYIGSLILQLSFGSRSRQTQCLFASRWGKERVNLHVEIA